jgi:hypothetical protein
MAMTRLNAVMNRESAVEIRTAVAAGVADER